MPLPKLTKTIFMKEVKCAYCGFPNLWVPQEEQEPFSCSRHCLPQASSPLEEVSSEDINRLEQRTGDEII
jgi:hypothetical protein